MAGLKAIKTKIRSIEKTKKVTKAMEAVSAAKMRRAQQAAVASRAYARAATSILSRLSGTNQLSNHPLMKRVGAGEETVAQAKGRVQVSAPAMSALYIVITSDKGLAGALNSAVLRASAADIREHNLTKESVSIIAIGRKANEYFTMRGYTVVAYYPNTDQIDSASMEEVLNAARVRFENGAVDTVKVAYQNFITTFEQRPTLRTVFPLSLEELQTIVSDIQLPKGAKNQPLAEIPAAYTVEPNEEDVLGAIVPRLAGIFLYHALLESQASEHSARMVSMKSASDKAGELTNILTIRFNKARQAAITQEISEITGGMAAMNTN